MCLEIVSRNMWHAIPARVEDSKLKINLPVTNVFLTYTNTYECQDYKSCKRILKMLQDRAMRIKHSSDIFYRYVLFYNSNELSFQTC